LLLGRLRPGTIPQRSLGFIAWQTSRAVLQQVLRLVLPWIVRTPLINTLYRALGMRIGRNVMISAVIVDGHDLIEIGDDCVVHSEVHFRTAAMPPAGHADERPLLQLQSIKVGQGCELGHGCMVASDVAPGTYVPPNGCSSWGTAAAQPASSRHHFVAESHLSSSAQLASAAMAGLVHVVALLLTSVGLYHTFSPACQHVGWVLANTGDLPPLSLLVLPLLPLSLLILGAAHVMFGLLVLYKWMVLGQLHPGTSITGEPYCLTWRYSVFVRLSDSLLMRAFMALYGTTPLCTPIWSLLGVVFSTPGKSGTSTSSRAGSSSLCYLPDLTCYEGHALTVEGCAAGSSCRVSCVDAAGTVQAVVLGPGAACGTWVHVGPGAQLLPGSVVGDRTSLAAGEQLGQNVVKQGDMRFKLGSSPAGAGTPTTEDAADARFASRLNSSAAAAAAWLLGGLQSMLHVVALMLLAPLSIYPGHLTFAVAAWAIWESSWQWWAALLLLPAAVAAGVLVQVMVVLQLRLLLLPGGAHTRPVPVLSRSNSMYMVLFAAATSFFEPLQGTSFAAWVWRMLGASVGQHVLLLCPTPKEVDLLPVGSGSAHSIEGDKFVYAPIELGPCSWLRACCRLMPASRMGTGACLDVASVAMKGETLFPKTEWRGNPAQPVGPSTYSTAARSVQL